MDDLFDERAHARRSDPDTSHEAARAIDPHLSALQRRVEHYAFGKGKAGFCDAEMCEELGDKLSTLRTRRAELAARNIIVDTTFRRTWGQSRRLRAVWVHRDHHHSPPALQPPVDHQRQLRDDEALANSLDGIADWLDSQDRDAAAETVRRGAARIRAKRGR